MNNEITLTDLFEVDMLQRIQDAFAKMTGLAAIITDAEGTPVTVGANFTDFCAKYTRNSPIGCLRCQQCDKHGAELALKVGSSVTYYCHAGLMDFAAPIMAGDKMIGCFVGGQVLTSPPDITKVMQVAAEIDIDLINYLQSVMSVPIIEKSNLDNAAFFLYTLTDALSSIAYHKYVMKEANIEIEKAANMKSDFLANMSHELRTPMNAVIGMAEMALREEMTPTAKSYISQIKVAGKSLLTIINDILDFSKIESGKMDIVEVEYEPMAMISDISAIISTRIDMDNVEFVLDISPNLPKLLFGDNIRLKQIVINLANNAAKFTKTGQVLLKFDFEPAANNTINLLFSVKDTGIGIKQADMEKIFQSFQQVDSKRNRNIEGTGLGLAISKQLLALMGGNIHVESIYGEGSTFSFNVPQKIVDKTPSVSLSDTDPTPTAMGFLKNEFAHAQLKRDMTKLNIDFMDLKDMNILSFLSTHNTPSDNSYLFISYSDFTPSIQDFLRNKPELSAVVVTPNDISVEYEIPNVIVAGKPLTAASIAAIYNHETLNQNTEHSSDEYYDFTAESAHVLIVDDNSINLTVAEGLLEPLNMKIDTALSGNEAITKISNEKYDLILMDHMMPELDGIETTHIIRRFHPEYEHVPIIALTANAMGDAQQMFLKEGLNDFVAKPIEVRMLVTAIHKWLPKSKIKKRTVSTKKPAEAALVLPDIPDLDVAGAVKLIGSEKLFMTILADYYRAIPKKLSLIKEYKDNKDWHNYTVEVHALKSASRQIGASELSKRAEALEAAGNANDIDTIMADTDAALEMYSHYKDVLAPFFPEKAADTGDKPPINKTVLLGVFDEMMKAIDDLDMDKMETILSKLDNYHFEGENEELCKRLREAVGEMDPDMCEAVIHTWKSIT